MNCIDCPKAESDCGEECESIEQRTKQVLDS